MWCAFSLTSPYNRELKELISKGSGSYVSAVIAAVSQCGCVLAVDCWRKQKRVLRGYNSSQNSNKPLKRRKNVVFPGKTDDNLGTEARTHTYTNAHSQLDNLPTGR